MQEYPDFNDSGKNPARITPFVFGAVLGAGLALLLAPAHGRDTRRRVGSSMKQLGSNAKDVFQRTKESMNDIKNDAKSAIDKGRQEYMKNRSSQTPAI